MAAAALKDLAEQLNQGDDELRRVVMRIAQDDDTHALRVFRGCAREALAIWKTRLKISEETTHHPILGLATLVRALESVPPDENLEQFAFKRSGDTGDEIIRGFRRSNGILVGMCHSKGPPREETEKWFKENLMS